MKKTGYLLLLMLLVSCDVAYFLTIQDAKNYLINTKCSTITVNGATLNGISPFICFNFDGEFVINLDSLIIICPNKNKISKYRFMLNGDMLFISNKEKTIVYKGDKLCISFTNLVDFNILPSIFIECNGEPVITDTIYIKATQIPYSGEKDYGH